MKHPQKRLSIVVIFMLGTLFNYANLDDGISKNTKLTDFSFLKNEKNKIGVNDKESSFN